MTKLNVIISVSGGVSVFVCGAQFSFGKTVVPRRDTKVVTIREFLQKTSGEKC